MKRKYVPNLATEAFRTLAENSPDIIDRFDREFHHLYVNAAGLRLLGLPAEKVVGKTIRETGLAKPYYSLWEKRISEVFATARPKDLTDAFPYKTGTRFYESRCVPEVSPDGSVQTVLVISRDVTERKRAEELLEQRVAERTVELKRRSRQLAELAAELSLAEHRERRRLADILHDHLQQLLVAARMEADSLSAPSKHGDRKGLHKLRNILVEALQTARGITQELVPPIPLHHHLPDAFQWLVQNAKSRYQLEVETRIGKGLDDVPEAESVLLYTAARELLLNVVKHAGTLSARLDLRWDAGAVILEIRDEGKGFDPAILRVEKGQGYGLFSIQERTGLLGGHLSLEARPGRGVRVTLTLPVVSGPSLPRPGDAHSRKRRKAEISTAGRKSIPAANATPVRVLFADDHRTVREAMVKLLCSKPGIKVVGQANNGREAVDNARRLQPDVVVMDVSMPVMDGIEATRLIKKRLPKIKVVGLSMYDKCDKMLRAGADCYVTKGAPPSQLIAAILRIARKPGVK